MLQQNDEHQQESTFGHLPTRMIDARQAAPRECRVFHARGQFDAQTGRQALAIAEGAKSNNSVQKVPTIDCDFMTLCPTDLRGFSLLALGTTRQHNHRELFPNEMWSPRTIPRWSKPIPQPDSELFLIPA